MLQDQPHHQTDQCFSYFLRQVWPIGQVGRYSAFEQIQLLCCKALPAPIADRWRRRLSCHGSLPDSDRERSHLHCEAEHSMMSRRSSTHGRAARTTHQAPPVNKRIGREVSVGCARGAIEHPCRNLQPPLDLRAVQSAAQGYVGSLFDHLVNKDVAPAPRMKPIQNVPANGPVGVPKPPCTMRFARTCLCTRTPPCRGRSGQLAACLRCRPWAGYTINMFEFEFATRTGTPVLPASIERILVKSIA